MSLDYFILKGKRYPNLIQMGMGAGISLADLVIAVTEAGGLGVLSTVALDLFVDEKNLSIEDAVVYECQKVRTAIGDKPFGVNVMVALRDYEEIIRGAIKGTADVIFTGAGIRKDLFSLIERSYHEIHGSSSEVKTAVVPIFSNAAITGGILERWSQQGHSPDAIYLELPYCGGHAGVASGRVRKGTWFEECNLERVHAEFNGITGLPIIAGGGIIDYHDREHALRYDQIVATGHGTVFLLTTASGAAYDFKQAILDAETGDIVLLPKGKCSPCGFPFSAHRGSPVFQTPNRPEFSDICLCSSLMAATPVGVPEESIDKPCPYSYIVSKTRCRGFGKATNQAVWSAGSYADRVNKIRTPYQVVHDLTHRPRLPIIDPYH